MQILQQGKTLEAKTIEDILKIMSNEQAMKILCNTIDVPQSAWEISRSSGVSLTQVYRWIRKLHNAGFIRVSGNTNSSGKKFFMYQSKINSFRVILDSSPEVMLEIN